MPRVGKLPRGRSDAGRGRREQQVDVLREHRGKPHGGLPQIPASQRQGPAIGSQALPVLQDRIRTQQGLHRLVHPHAGFDHARAPDRPQGLGHIEPLQIDRHELQCLAGPGLMQGTTKQVPPGSGNSVVQRAMPAHARAVSDTQRTRPPARRSAALPAIQGSRIRAMWLAEDLHGQRQVLCRARHGSQVRELHERALRPRRYVAETRLEGCHAGIGGRNAHRTAGIAADGQRTPAAGQLRRRAAARAAHRPARIQRIQCPAVERAVAMNGTAHFRRAGLAEQHGAARAQQLDGGRILRRSRLGRGQAPAPQRQAGHGYQILDGYRHPIQA